MAPTTRELELQKTAKLLIYALEKDGKNVPQWVHKAVESYARPNEHVVPELCALLKGMTDEKRHEFLYEDIVGNKTALELAAWWAEHQEADAAREAKEAEAEAVRLFRQQARAKAVAHLTPAERRILHL